MVTWQYLALTLGLNWHRWNSLKFFTMASIANCTLTALTPISLVRGGNNCLIRQWLVKKSSQHKYGIYVKRSNTHLKLWLYSTSVAPRSRALSDAARIRNGMRDAVALLRHFHTMWRNKSQRKTTQFRQKYILIETSAEEFKPIASKNIESRSRQSKNFSLTFSHIQPIKIQI